jgi:hypothetical protein
MNGCEVSELAEELAQVTCGHLPWSDQRVIVLELGCWKETLPTSGGSPSEDVGVPRGWRQISMFPSTN